MPDRFGKVIVVGDACMDVHLQISDILADVQIPYETTLGGTCGGSVAMLSRLGVPTAFLGTLGNDYAGRFILKELTSLGVDTGRVIVKVELNTINVYAFIDEEGERHLWGFPRSEQAYPDLDMDRIDTDRIRTASWLHTSGMSMLAKGSIQESVPELFRIAYEAGVPTSLDLNTRVADLRLLDPKAVEAITNTLPYVRYLTGSAKDEFYSFYPCEDYRDSIRHFAKEGRTIIARMGRDGCLLFHEGKETYIPSYQIEAKNTTGAGDCFDAGFIAATLEGRNVIEACRYASAVAAYKICGNMKNEKIDRQIIEDFMNHTALRGERT